MKGMRARRRAARRRMRILLSVLLLLGLGRLMLFAAPKRPVLSTVRFDQCAINATDPNAACLVWTDASGVTHAVNWP